MRKAVERVEEIHQLLLGNPWHVITYSRCRVADSLGRYLYQMANAVIEAARTKPAISQTNVRIALYNYQFLFQLWASDKNLLQIWKRQEWYSGVVAP
jgi:hypothetical protein